jgi:asparagine synthase (glutamine-hydrolysing)
MCGIAGVVGSTLPGLGQEPLERMQRSILFRGLDEQGAWSDGRSAFLCQARLSIVDVEHGQQPMATPDGKLTLVFGGEIYNHVELRRAYEAEGARFRTRSDTEVILEGYRLRGPAVCEELNGMFTFAVWDAEREELFLARDRLGKKPLYWCRLGQLFAFSSSLDGFEALPGWSGALSEAGVELFKAIGAFPEDVTVYEQAHSLPPASRLRVRAGRAPDIDRYWRLDFGSKLRAPLDELVGEYEELMVDATRIRLRSDVPTALSFSGGIDSGTVAWACARKLEVPISCFTIDEHTEENPSAETLVAEQAARHLGLPWQHIQFTASTELLAGLEEPYSFYDEPCSSIALVYSDRLYRAIKPHATVVLSGNGGDELFIGYAGHERIRQKDLVARAARPFRPLLRPVGRLPRLLRMSPADAFEHMLVERAGQSVRSVAATLAQEVREAGAERWLDAQMFESMLWWNRDGNFRVPDISGLAGQVEVRSPFFDHRVVEFAARLPHRYKVNRLFSPEGNKFLPRHAYREMMPSEVANAPKRGMGSGISPVSFVEDPKSVERFFSAYDRLEEAGLDDGTGKRAWRSFQEALRTGGNRAPYSGPMMTRFMLAAWLERTPAVAPVAA